MVVAILYKSPKHDVPDIKDCFAGVDGRSLTPGSFVWTPITGRDLPTEFTERFRESRWRSPDLDQILGFAPAMYHFTDEMVMGGDASLVSRPTGGHPYQLPPVDIGGGFNFYNLDYERLVQTKNAHEEHHSLILLQ